MTLRIYLKFQIPNSKFRQDGIAALATIMIIGLFLFAAGILIVTLGNTSVLSGQYNTQSDKAHSLAEAGIQDALIQLARNMNFATTTSSYSITTSDGTATITLTAGSPVVITSSATVTQGNDIIQSVVKANVTLDANGKITSVSQTNI